MKISSIYGGRDPDRRPDFKPVKRGGEYICRICEFRGGGDPCDACLRLEESLMDYCDAEAERHKQRERKARRRVELDWDVRDEILLGRGSWEQDKPEGGLGFDYTKPEPKLPEGW